MKSPARALAVALLSGLAAAGDPRVIDHLDSTTLPRSGRVSIHGKDLEPSGQIHLAGIPPLVVPIPGTNAIQMIAYVPESTPYGPCPVTVTTTSGTSHAVPLLVQPTAPDKREL